METKPNNDSNYLCPSYISKPGAQLFGYINDGKVEYLQESIVVDKTFVEEAKKGRTPESRFRFAGKCIKGSCAQWNNTDGVCGLTNKLIDEAPEKEVSELEHCAIRSQCRWFAQRGAKACAVCSDSVRNMEEAYIGS
jgi:hypothetical protein